MDVDAVIQTASQAMCECRFGKANELLLQALEECSDVEEKEILLQHLVHLYEHPLNRNLEKARTYMVQREALNPSAYSALASAQFYLHTVHDDRIAREWSETSTRRAIEEHDWSTLYSAAVIIGLVAIRQGDREGLQKQMDQLEVMLDRDDERVSYGDAVPLLESLKSDDDTRTRKRVQRLAERIADKIIDPEFRTRARDIANMSQ